MSATDSPTAVRSPAQWARLVLELIAVFAVFQWSAVALGSDRGQAGLIVGALVVSATVAVECAWPGQTLTSAVRGVGLAMPARRGIIASLSICALLLLVVPLFVLVTGAIVTLEIRSLRLLPGLFGQAGIAEEVLFRGYLFGHLRAGRSFWRAALLAMLPFALVHLLMFLTMPWPVALAALLLSIVLSFPLAHLFELGGRTVWPPALLHFVVQGTAKLVVFSGEEASTFPIVWMGASAVLPMFVMLIRGESIRAAARR